MLDEMPWLGILFWSAFGGGYLVGVAIMAWTWRSILPANSMVGFRPLGAGLAVSALGFVLLLLASRWIFGGDLNDVLLVYIYISPIYFAAFLLFVVPVSALLLRLNKLEWSHIAGFTAVFSVSSAIIVSLLFGMRGYTDLPGLAGIVAPYIAIPVGLYFAAIRLAIDFRT